MFYFYYTKSVIIFLMSELLSNIIKRKLTGKISLSIIIVFIVIILKNNYFYNSLSSLILENKNFNYVEFYGSKILEKNCTLFNIECLTLYLNNEYNLDMICNYTIFEDMDYILNKMIYDLSQNEKFENNTILTSKNYNFNYCLMVYKNKTNNNDDDNDNKNKVEIFINPSFIENPKFDPNNVIIKEESNNKYYCNKDFNKSIIKIHYKETNLLYYDIELKKNQNYKIKSSNMISYIEFYENLRFLYGKDICLNYNTYFNQNIN